LRLLIQRVANARVDVAQRTTGSIKAGLLVLVGLGANDTPAHFPKASAKLTGLRIFPDEAGNMNRSVADVAGGILLVSQFTLHADVRKGRRPSFTAAMPPNEARSMFQQFVDHVRAEYPHGPVETGEFGAMMQVHLVNDGPVTIWLDTDEWM